MSAVDRNTLVQPIMLPPDAKNYPLSAVVTAAATASARALEASDRDVSPWPDWLDGPFTKSVRVAKSRADFTQALSECVFTVEAGGVAAAAFAPLAYADMPKWMARARVEGLHCEDDLADRPGDGEWAVGVIAEMSAGKTAAQVAHALCIALLGNDMIPSFSLYRAPVGAQGEVEITDSGLTEFGGLPTLTVVASPR